MKKSNILERIHENYLVAVVRGSSKKEALTFIQGILEGGIYNIEVTFTTPQAHEVIAEIKQMETIERMVVGAGTVIDSITARLAILNGAEYIVSPHFDKEIAKICNLYSIPYLPGCGSVTEITEALTYGVDVVKLFPGDVLGPDFIKNIHGPLPHVEMMPSGGVTLNNLKSWYDKGAFAVGIGSALTKGARLKNNSTVITNTRAFVQKYNEIKG